MKFIHINCLALMLILTAFAASAAEEKIRAADQAAGKWLALVDARDYDEAWRRAAGLFKLQVGIEQWRHAVSAARTPLGSMISRKLVAANYVTSLPGAPDGEYVVLQYRAEFDRKKSAIEIVTPMLDNGSWRVSGYYIR